MRTLGGRRGAPKGARGSRGGVSLTREPPWVDRTPRGRQRSTGAAADQMRGRGGGLNLDPGDNKGRRGRILPPTRGVLRAEGPTSGNQDIRRWLKGRVPPSQGRHLVKVEDRDEREDREDKDYGPGTM